MVATTPPASATLVEPATPDGAYSDLGGGRQRAMAVRRPLPPECDGAARGARSSLRCPCNDLGTRCYPRLNDQPRARPRARLSGRAVRAHATPSAPGLRRPPGRAAAVRRDPARRLGRPRRRDPWATPFSSWAFHRAWWDAYGANAHEQTLDRPRPRPTPSRAASRSCRSCTATRSSRPTPLTAPTIRHGDALRADAGRRRPRRRLLRRLVPRRLRDDPRRARRPAGRRRGRRRPSRADAAPPIRTRRRGTSSTCAGCAAATRPPTRSPRPSGAREMREGWTLNVEREDVCPVVDAARRARLRRLPRDARQEGAPRDPAQGPPRRGGGRGRARRLDRPARRPRGLHRPPPDASWGDRRPVPADTRRRPEPGVRPPAVRAVRRRRARCRLAFLTVGGRRDRGRASTSRPADALLYYNAGVDPDARELSPGVVLVDALRPARARARHRAGSTSCAATSRTSTSGARSTSRSSGLAGAATKPTADGRARRAWRPLPRRRSSGRACPAPRAHPRRRGPRDRHERRRPGAPLQPRHPHRPRRATTSRVVVAVGRAAPCASSSGPGSP